jgi:hypothetical protein
MLPMPVAGLMPETNLGSGTAQSSQLKEVGRVRSVFSETWLWTNVTAG